MKVSVKKKTDGRAKPWFARFWKGRNRPVVKFFATRQEAEVYAQELRQKFKSGGSVEAINCVTVQDALDNHLAMLKQGGRRPITISSFGVAVRRLLRGLMDRRLSSIPGSIIHEAILNDSDIIRQQKKHLGCIKRLYKSAKVDLPVIEMNTEEYIWPKLDQEEIEYLSVEQARVYIENAPERLTAAIALMLFAGVRVEEVKRLSEAQINRVGRAIRIPAKVAKARRPRVLDQRLPDNLWHWLNKAELDTVNFRVRLMDYRKEIRQHPAFKNGWVTNGARHSFGTYHSVWMGVDGRTPPNFFITAKMMGHKSGLDILFDHYQGHSCEEEAAQYFRIGL